MATHDVFFPLLLAEAPGCPLPMVRTAINRASINFCARSKAWSETLDPVPVRAGIAEYEMDGMPTDAVLGVIASATLGGRKLSPSLNGIASADWGQIDGEPTHYAMSGPDILVLNRKPTASGSLLLRAALMPTLAAQTLPDVLANRYFEAVCEGAKSLLKRMPNQPWTDPAGAAAADALFRDWTSEARIEVDYGFVQGSMSVTPRVFGR